MPADTQQEFLSPVSDRRHQQLQQAGWPETDALLLAERPEVDLHVACDLLERGCDVATAWRILR